MAKELTVNMCLEVAGHEAIIRQAYKDSVNKWTWSAGLTNATGHNVERYIGNPQPMKRCIEVWLWALQRYLDEVLEAFRGFELKEHELAAALSFHWNTGAIKKASWVKHWKEGNIPQAKKAFLNYSKPPEIIPRRKKERDLFFDEKWSGDGTVLEFTKVKPSGHPDWSSGQRVNITEEVRRVLFGKDAPTVAPKPTVEAPMDATPVDIPKPVSPAPRGGSGVKSAVILAVMVVLAVAAYFFFFHR